MILAKEQLKPVSLIAMEALACRMILAKIDIEYLNSLQRGFRGEVRFVRMLSVLGNDVLVFPDLLLQPQKGNAFQLDVVVLIGRVFYIYEIKNYRGEWHYGVDFWESQYGTKIVNPEIRLEEKQNKFKILLEELGYDNQFEVKVHVVLVNPQCTMYLAPGDSSLLLPTQLRSHIEQLEKFATPLTAFHRQVMQAILARQGKEKVFWDNVPDYHWDLLEKSVYCEQCKSAKLAHTKYTYRCHECKHQDDVQSLIQSSIKDYQALFPLEKLSVGTIHEWINKKYSRKSVLRALKKFKETTEPKI